MSSTSCTECRRPMPPVLHLTTTTTTATTSTSSMSDPSTSVSAPSLAASAPSLSTAERDAMDPRTVLPLSPPETPVAAPKHGGGDDTWDSFSSSGEYILSSNGSYPATVTTTTSSESDDASNASNAAPSARLHALRKRLLHSPQPPEIPASYRELPGVVARLIGTGAWSDVFETVLERGDGRGVMVVAVKRPLNVSAQAVLRNEARTLAYLSHPLVGSILGSTSPGPATTAAVTAAPSPHLAAFHGLSPLDSSIYMQHIPGPTLSTHFRRLASSPESERLTLALSIGAHLADAFCLLKSAGVVHGDVKWDNVLLPPSGVPVVVDFSSANLVVEGVRPGPVSAVTEDFCAPELLAAFLPRPRRRRQVPAGVVSPPESPTIEGQRTAVGMEGEEEEEPRPVPNYQSDLYGLAMTVLCMVLGDTVYADRSRHVAIFAREGEPLRWVANAGRIGRRTLAVVAPLLKGCFGKTAEGRIEVEELRERFRALVG